MIEVGIIYSRAIVRCPRDLLSIDTILVRVLSSASRGRNTDQPANLSREKVCFEIDP